MHIHTGALEFLKVGAFILIWGGIFRFIELQFAPSAFSGGLAILY